jgi:hypothetical protein
MRYPSVVAVQSLGTSRVSFALEYEYAKTHRASRSAPKLGGREGLRGWSSKRAG